MKNEKISVIVPLYNTEEYIEKCIMSILNQTYKNLEIIIVDDGSTDNSCNICKELQKYDDRIKIINQTNQGVSIARNKGLENATGKYIAFVDSDDYLEPDMYEKLLNYIITTNSDIASARAYIFDRSGIIEMPHYNNYVEEYDDIKSILKAYVDGFLTIAVWDKLFTREAIGNVKFDETVFCEDAKFVLDVCRNTSKVICSSERLYNHLKRTGNSITNSTFNEFYMTLYYYAENIRSELLKEYPQCENEIQQFYFNSVYHLIKIYKRDWDRNKLENYYFSEINQLIKSLRLFLKQYYKCINPKLVISANDIMEILEFRLEKIK